MHLHLLRRQLTLLMRVAVKPVAWLCLQSCLSHAWLSSTVSGMACACTRAWMKGAMRSCRDGESNNLSWNCGAEGGTKKAAVLRLRARQMRNLACALLLSHGVPMVLMGDEYGHTKVSHGGMQTTLLRIVPTHSARPCCSWVA